MMKAVIYHNILWSRYKGVVFSEIHRLSNEAQATFEFVQIAETDHQRAGLVAVDSAYHRYPYELLFRGSYFSIPAWRRMWRLFIDVWRRDAELVVLPGYHLPEFWCMLLAALLTGKSRAVFSDSTIYDQPQTLFRGVCKRIFFLLCNGYFAYGERARAYLMHYGAPSNRIFLRRQAAALPDGYAAESALARRLEGTRDAAKPRYLYVGRLSEEKSLDTLLRAFKLLRKGLPQAELMMVGSGPLRSALEELTRNLGVDAGVRFLGPLETHDLSLQYAQATSLVLTSMSEAWGLVVNEALSYGCPVVVSDRCGCVPELVVPNITGFSFKSGDITDLAAKMTAAIELSADRRRTAENCLAVISRFTPERAAKAVIGGCLEIARDEA